MGDNNDNIQYTNAKETGASRHKRVFAAIITVFLLLFLALVGCGVSFWLIGGENGQSTIENPQNDNTLTGFSNILPSSSNGISINKRRNTIAPTYAVVQKSSSGVLMEASTRRVLKNENMRTRCYPASTTKVLTALVVLKRLPLDLVITVPKEAVGIEGSSIYLKEGDKISVEHLLYGLMLRSGNDAATALAIAACGSVDAFAQAMNDTAKECGADNSNFVNPHGLHDDNHYTTAYDLALITAAAYENDDFSRIVATKTARIFEGDQGVYIGNKNKLLNMFEGANGVKTGYTKTSGRCLVGGAKKDGMQLITVVLNYNDMWNDTIRLLKYGFDNYEMVPLTHATMLREGKPVTISTRAICSSNWRDKYYPLKKVGEYAVMVS